MTRIINFMLVCVKPQSKFMYETRYITEFKHSKITENTIIINLN